MEKNKYYILLRLILTHPLVGRKLIDLTGNLRLYMLRILYYFKIYLNTIKIRYLILSIQLFSSNECQLFSLIHRRENSRSN